MKRILAFLTTLALSTLGLSAETFNEAGSIAQEDLQAALSELGQIRRQIENERIPLAKQLNSLEIEALGKRKEADRVRRLRDNRQFDLNSLEDRTEKLRDNNSYLSSLLSDYIRRFETQIHIAERQLFEEQLVSAHEAIEDPNMSDQEKFRRKLDMINEAFTRLESTIGGRTFDGGAVMPDGLYQKGQFATVGPIAYFASSESDAAGIAQLEVNSLNAVIEEMNPQFLPGIREFVTTKQGSQVAFDSTLGDAALIDKTKETLVEHISKGGLVMYPILGLFSLAILVAIFKVFDIFTVSRAKARDLDAILEHLRNGNESEAASYAKGVRGPVGQMLSSGVEHWKQEREVLEEAMYEKIIITQPRLERLLPVIAVVAATAPLLGLLGTVTGMIRTFKLITVFGTGDAKSLSSGISEALITTEFGLIVAIPTLILHALLSRAAKGVIAGMEQTAVGFINGASDIRENQ